jgi:hypothetical protein
MPDVTSKLVKSSIRALKIIERYKVLLILVERVEGFIEIILRYSPILVACSKQKFVPVYESIIVEITPHENHLKIYLLLSGLEVRRLFFVLVRESFIFCELRSVVLVISYLKFIKRN